MGGADAARARFQKQLTKAYRATEDGLRGDFPALSIYPIGPRALAFWQATWRPAYSGASKRGEWDWEDLLQRFAAPERIDGAMWVGDQLCGMFVGKPSEGRTRTSIHYIAGPPYPGHALKGAVIPIGVAFALKLGDILDSDAVRFVSPYPDIVWLYEEQEFTFYPAVGGLPSYCERVI